MALYSKRCQVCNKLWYCTREEYDFDIFTCKRVAGVYCHAQ